MHDSIEGIAKRVSLFADVRDWRQFHTPRNLVLALAGEVGELAAKVQWTPDERLAEDLQDREAATGFRHELADVLIYAFRLAEVAGIDIIAAMHEKLDMNELKYPVPRSRGTSAKYTDLPLRADEDGLQ